MRERELYNENMKRIKSLVERADETIQPHLTVDEVDGQQVSTSMTTRSFYVAVAHRSSTYMLISPPPFYRNGDGRTLLRLRNNPSKEKQLIRLFCGPPDVLTNDIHSPCI